MDSTSLSLPVHVEPSFSDVMHGVFEIDGLLRLDLDERTLTLEYQTNNSFSGDSTVETVALSLDDVSRSEARHGLFRGRLTLYPARLAAFRDVPGVDAGRVVLRVRRRHLDTLQRLDERLKAASALAVPAAPSSDLPSTTLAPLPFKIHSVHAGFSHATGMLSFEDEFVVFDTQVVALSLIKHEPAQLRVERSVIQDARLVRRLRHDRLYLTPKKFELLAAMPGRHRDELRLDVRTKHRDLAEHVVAVLRHAPA